MEFLRTEQLVSLSESKVVVHGPTKLCIGYILQIPYDFPPPNCRKLLNSCLLTLLSPYNAY